METPEEFNMRFEDDVTKYGDDFLRSLMYHGNELLCMIDIEDLEENPNSTEYSERFIATLHTLNKLHHESARRALINAKITTDSRIVRIKRPISGGNDV